MEVVNAFNDQVSNIPGFSIFSGIYEYEAGERLEPKDPFYMNVPKKEPQKMKPGEKVEYKEVKRKPPPFITEKQRKLYKKIFKRAWYHDRNFCGCTPLDLGLGMISVVTILPIIGAIIAYKMHYKLVKACHQAGVPATIQAKMVSNVGIDCAIGLVPLLGVLFCWMRGCSSRNFKLFDEWIRSEAHANAAKVQANAAINNALPVPAGQGAAQGAGQGVKPGMGPNNRVQQKPGPRPMPTGNRNQQDPITRPPAAARAPITERPRPNRVPPQSQPQYVNPATARQANQRNIRSPPPQVPNKVPVPSSHPPTAPAAPPVPQHTIPVASQTGAYVLPPAQAAYRPNTSRYDQYDQYARYRSDQQPAHPPPQYTEYTQYEQPGYQSYQGAQHTGSQFQGSHQGRQPQYHSRPAYRPPPVQQYNDEDTYRPASVIPAGVYPHEQQSRQQVYRKPVHAST